MTTLSKNLVLNTLIQHETLTIDSISKQETLGLTPNVYHLNSLLHQLKETGHIDILNNVMPVTYTITSKGIDEGIRLVNKEANKPSI